MGIAFQVVSVRVLGDKEASTRAPDFLSSNVAVRLRISCMDRGFYFYALKGAAIPVGYAVKLTDQGSVWLGGRSGAEKSSPGLQQGARQQGGAFEKRRDFLFFLQYYILQEDQPWMISHLQSLRALHI